MKKIIIFGGSGFIGRHLMNELGSEYKFIVPSRDPHRIKEKLPVNAEAIKLNDIKNLILFFEQADGIVNLSGENVNGRWTRRKRRAISSSRLMIDRLILSAFNASNNNIKFIIQGSGIGIYGFSRENEEINEFNPRGRHGFLTRIGYKHERALHNLEEKTRVIFIRTGLVLDKEESALPKMAAPFFYNLGGTMGSGKQWNSWIHIKDEVRAIKFLMESETARGIYNLTAPLAVKQREFAKTLGNVLNRSSFFKKPAFLLSLMLGKMAKELVNKGLNIKPTRLIEEGFIFRFGTLKKALKDIYKKQY
jgi:uncharacterized protein (TIGR01777 family)